MQWMTRKLKFVAALGLAVPFVSMQLVLFAMSVLGAAAESLGRSMNQRCRWLARWVREGWWIGRRVRFRAGDKSWDYSVEDCGVLSEGACVVALCVNEEWVRVRGKGGNETAIRKKDLRSAWATTG